jgi:signal transduction histidine kinase
VQAIAVAHGGGASVSSRPGGGSVFAVRLPVLQEEADT